MDKLIANPRRAAWVSAALAAPITILIFIAGLRIEPLASFLRGLWTGPDGRQSQTGFALAAILIALLLAGLAISIASVVQTVRSGAGLGSNAVNLFLATAIGAFVITLGVGLLMHPST